MRLRPGEGWLRPPLVVAAVALLVASAFWALAVWKPGPPRTVTIATGPEGSAYATFGARYRAILARSGVDLRLQATAGAVENLARLRDAASGVSIAFVQAGTATAEDADPLASLGSVFHEPLWLFHRGLDVARGFAALRGKRMSIGLEGSGTRELALRTLRLGGIDSGSGELVSLGPGEAAARLTRGEIDIAAIVTSWDSPVVHELLTTPGVELASFPRADAHLALNPYLSKLVLPAGVADLGRNIPPADVVLVAPKASLVVRRDLHPALQYLLLDAAVEIHSPPGLFHRAGEFPAAESIDLPLSEDARQFYKSGRPFLQRYLPFWLGVLAERLLVLLIPLVGAVYPLARSAPALYAWTVRRRIFRLYGELKLIEVEMEGKTAEAPAGALLARLDDLDKRVSRLRVPRGHASLAYTLRHHIRLVRERLTSLPGPPAQQR
jgi:TRAP transporter TAXI family solute receptor